MAITECGNGHVYDTDQYAACPYCNGGRNIIDFSGGNQGGDIGKTVIPQNMAPQQNPVNPQFGMGNTEAVNYAMNANEPSKTVAPEAYRKNLEDQNKTVAVFKQQHNLDPVVGWFVCIEGPEKGVDYHMWAKINTIGRSEKNDICIKKDMTVSKDNHARIAYDPKHNNFQLIPGESTNNIYVNDDPIYVPTKLEAYDVVELGSSKMVFVPFCSDKFKWSDVEKTES